MTRAPRRSGAGLRPYPSHLRTVTVVGERRPRLPARAVNTFSASNVAEAAGPPEAPGHATDAAVDVESNTRLPFGS